MTLTVDAIGHHRAQTGVRIDSSLIKVLKALAEYCDISMADLLQTIVLNSFDNKLPFNDETLRTIERLKKVYDCDLKATDCPCLNHLTEH